MARFIVLVFLQIAGSLFSIGFLVTLAQATL
jgi:hypothetical protein